MNHLKSYKIFEATQEELEEQLAEEKQWIKDSLIELVDARCIIAVSPFEIKSISRPGLRIGIVSTNDRLIPISVGDHLLTIDSYLRERGFVGFRPYDYDNPYSASRYQVTVNAMLKNVKNMFENELSQFVKMLDRFTVNAPFDSISVSYFKPEPEINESKEELSIDMVKDILLSVYEEEFDSHKFEFFNYVESRNANEINFIPNKDCFYFNISKDKWNTEGSIRFEIVSVSFWSLDKYDLDKYQLFSELISEWGWRVSEPSKYKPSDAAFIYRPRNEGGHLVMDTLRKCSYSIIPN